MMTDAASFGVSLGAVYLAERGATSKMTFGHGRVEVLAALWSTLSIWLLTGLLVGEACRRIGLYVNGKAEPVNGAMMTILGTFGVAMNLVLERVLGGHDHEHGGHHSHSHGHSHAAETGSRHQKKEARQELVRIEEGDYNHHDHDDDHDHDDHHHDDHDHHDHHDHDHHDHDHHDDDHHHRDHDHHEGHPHEEGKGSESTRLLKQLSYSAVSTSGHDHHDEHDHHDDSDDDDAIVNNMNIDAAYLHVLGDLLQSLGVVVAGIIIWINPSFVIADPICTLLFAVFVLVTTCSMIQRTILVLLQGAPDQISVDSLHADLAAIEGVCDVHDLHVWELTPGRPLLSVHVGILHESPRTIEEVLAEAHAVSKDAGIEFATIQVMKTFDGKCASHSCFQKTLKSA